MPAVFVLVVYTVWVICALGVGHNVRDFANVGSQSRAAVDDSVPVIHDDARYAFSSSGYDGQYFLAIARAPTRATRYLDFPQYRYSRIGYPLVARAAALGNQSAIPYALVAVNVLAVALTTLLLGLWLTRSGVSPWFALVYSFFPGVLVAVQRDLSEPLAYLLAAAGIVVFDPRRLRPLVVSALLFAFAAVTRESAALLALGCVAVLLLEKGGHFRSRAERVFAAAVYGAAVLAPYLCYRIVLSVTVAVGAGAVGPTPSSWPLRTVVSYWRHLDVAYVYSVIAPSIAVGLTALWALLRGFRSPAVVALLASVLVFVVFAPSFAYDDPAGALRTIIAIPVATVLAIPTLNRAMSGRNTWLWVAAIAWFAPWWDLLPLALNRSWS